VARALAPLRLPLHSSDFTKKNMPNDQSTCFGIHVRPLNVVANLSGPCYVRGSNNSKPFSLAQGCITPRPRAVARNRDTDKLDGDLLCPSCVLDELLARPASRTVGRHFVSTEQSYHKATAWMDRSS